MANAWMRGIGRVNGKTPGGRPQGGAPRAVWHMSESDPNNLSARSVAQRLDSDGRTSHLVWNPVTGDTVQLLPATAAAAGQLTPGLRTDRAREGRVCIVIQVVGYSLLPFTDGPLNGLDPILRWLDSWEIPRWWPAGPPAPFPASHSPSGSERLWAQGGHFGHSQVPGSRADGPGAIDIGRLRGVPLPFPAPGLRSPSATGPLSRVRPSANGVRPHAATGPT
ncbi:hypothetical protein [Actinorugispora endophytica]|uniref:Uncharacterized protein n=1 Tax=Actinorugispora endophytica TaxID=1605990 RepID=A0A4R6UV30_9ACTN|nr:hypothetical protein [Actinorugispora endophytica]TDQ49275.1 hypothetical protein EV190_11672 [Actinorugispora endophytica]